MPRFERARWAGLLPLAAVLVPLSILVVVGWLNWRAVWDDARSQVLRAAETAAEYGARTLESYSLAAGRLNDRLRGLSDADIRENEEALHQELRRIGADLSQSDLAYVVDRDGYPLLTSNLFPVPRDATLADRDYFQALKGPVPPAVHISEVLIGRFDGRLLFSVSRRRRDTGNPPTADGFDGVVLVSVSPLTLADGMRRLLAEPTDRMAFVREDGYGITTTSGAMNPGQPLTWIPPQSPFHTFAAEGAHSAVYLSRTIMPGTTALLAMQRIEGFPVYAVTIRPGAEITARWWSIMAPHLAFGIPATLGLFLLSLRVWRDQRRLAASNAELRTDNDLSTDRLIRAKRFGLVGTFEFDLRTGISRRSPEYMSVHGLAAIATEETHDDWSRRLHPDDRQRAEQTLWDALSQESGATEYAQTYRTITPEGEVRWIAARGEITRDAAGRAILLRGAHVDVTPLRATELALAESDARLRLAQEALGIGTWEWLRRTRSLTCSRKMAELWGFDPDGGAIGLGAMLSRVDPRDRRQLRPLLTLDKGDGTFRCEFRILRPLSPDETETVWIAARARQLAAAQAVHPRLMGVAYDITERKRTEERAALMAHEVEHRAKNALAVVSGLLRMTKAESAEDLVNVMDGRVRALSRTIGLLGKGRWLGTELREILQSELQPFELAESGDGFEMELSGPEVLIDVESAQPLAMAFHELATNAAKYGALSVPGGRLTIDWSVEAGRVHLLWRESGGPRVEGPPQQMGFGSQLIRMLFEGQIQGEVAKRWEPEGLVCEIRFPVCPRR
ncbi:sensor histidine kinase [Humitalea sp. 24SJ18S-53]|uniref:sensor histidine kinase n=1 Tax=Humitalea sp. 24SJ18S-53 TaxID=3422307 RepID=UPI003D680060